MNAALDSFPGTGQQFQLPPGPLEIVDRVLSEASICVNAVTFDLLRSGQTHQTHGKECKHWQSSC
jgi:hypothetical protein